MSTASCPHGYPSGYGCKSCALDQTPLPVFRSAADERIAELEAELSALKAKNEILKKSRTRLPYITDGLHDEFGDTCLMTWDRERGRPHWSQIAVDFAAVVQEAQAKREEPPQ